MISAMYSIFNCQDLIYSSLTSVAPAVDEIRIYDGRYSDYRCSCGSDHDSSCDGTMQEIERWLADYDLEQPAVRIFQWQAKPEMEKRTKMMRDVPLGTMTLTIDDDELLVGSPKPIHDFDKQVGYIDFLFAQAGPGTGAVIPLARLIRTTPGIRYESYYRILDDSGVVVDMKQDNVNIPYGRRAANRNYLPPTTYMVELWNYRSKRRSESQLEYNRTIAPRGWR